MNTTTARQKSAAASATRARGHTYKRTNTKEGYMKRRTAKVKNLQTKKKELRREIFQKKREGITFSNIQERTLSKKPPELILFNMSHGIVSDMSFLDKGLYWYSSVPIEGCLLFTHKEKDRTNILTLAELYQQFPNQHHHILTNYCNYLNQTDNYDYKLVKNILSVMKSYLPILMVAFVEAKKPDPILAKLNTIFEQSRVSFEELDFANTKIMNYDSQVENTNIDMNELYRITSPVVELAHNIYELFLELTPSEQTHLKQFIPFNTHFDFFMNYMEKATQYVGQLPKYLTHKPAVRCGFKRLLKNKLFVYSEDVPMNGLYVISAGAGAPIQPFLIPSDVRGVSKINIAHLKQQMGVGGGDGGAILINELCNALHLLGYGNIALYDYSCNSTEEDYKQKIANYERNSFIRDITPATASRAI